MSQNPRGGGAPQPGDQAETGVSSSGVVPTNCMFTNVVMYATFNKLD